MTNYLSVQYLIFVLLIIDGYSFKNKFGICYKREIHQRNYVSKSQLSRSILEEERSRPLCGFSIPLVIILSSILPVPDFSNSINGFPTNQVLADSTGKFSTKLTAKRRYLPVIKEETTRLFSILASCPTESVSITDGCSELLGSIKSWMQEDLPKMKKAMILYGVSLRKSEYPDEISRQAEQLTNQFVKEAESLNDLLNTRKKLTSKDIRKQVTVLEQSLNDYLTFSKIYKEF